MPYSNSSTTIMTSQYQMNQASQTYHSKKEFDPYTKPSIRPILSNSYSTLPSVKDVITVEVITPCDQAVNYSSATNAAEYIRRKKYNVGLKGNMVTQDPNF